MTTLVLSNYSSEHYKKKKKRKEKIERELEKLKLKTLLTFTLYFPHLTLTNSKYILSS